jgi:ribose 1,5-bisphosphate isomerase
LARIADYGASKVCDGDTVFMYSMSSTVWRILRRAWEQGKRFNVIVTESRPANEGLWTVTEMAKAGIPVAVSIDACIGELVPQADIVFVGADAVSSHGYSLCKVGTYPTALVAKAHGVPFYIAADTLKFDASTLLGLPFRVDPIHRHEVLNDQFPPEARVVGRIFDETPPELVTAIITERGLLNPAACITVMWQSPISERLNALLPAWARGEL